ncbi:MAG: LLM class flavin-dependent oxidoreductase [Actinomycetota bacterium]
MTFSVGFGPITVQSADGDSREAAQLWKEALDYAGEAEVLGFDSVWVGEHHFTADGYLPSVFPFLAAIAARTERVTIGSKVLLAPLHHPIRVAEDAAAVQLISGGRLVVGAAIGYRPEEFDGFGVRLSQRAQRLERMVEICRAAWSGSPVELENSDMAAVTVYPMVGDIPIWLGGRAPAALARVGRVADGYIAPVGTVDDLTKQVAAVDAAAEVAGRAGALDVASSSFVIVRSPAVDADRARAALDRLLGFYQGVKAGDLSSRVGRSTDSDPMIIDGPPAEVIRRLRRFADLLPASRNHHHIVRLEFPGMTSSEVHAHMRVFAEDVLPALR